MKKYCTRCHKNKIEYKGYCRPCLVILVAENIIEDEKYMKKHTMRKPRKKTTTSPEAKRNQRPPCAVCKKTNHPIIYGEFGEVCSSCYREKYKGNSVVC